MPGILTASVLRTSQSHKNWYLDWCSHILPPKVMSLQSPEWRDVGLTLAWPVVSSWPPQCDQYLYCQSTNVESLIHLVPLHQTFHPWSKRNTLENLRRITQSFLFTQPRGVSAVCCWASASGRQFTLCGNSSVSLFSGVCSSRAVRVHQACLACMTIQRGVPSAGVVRKVSFSGRLMSILSTGSFTRYEGLPQQLYVPLYMLPPPTGPSLPSSPCRCQL